MWREDGWKVSSRIGILTPHADVGPESELQAMARSVGVGVHAARVPFGAMAAAGQMDPTIPLAPVAAFVEPPGIDDAVRLLADAPIEVIGIAFTSSSYVTGVQGERATVDRLSGIAGHPVVATCAAAAAGLHAVGAARPALVDPPWFDAELNRMGADYFAAQDLDVVFHSPAGLPSDQRSIKPSQLCDWVVAHVPDEADSVFIGGNGFRSVGAISAMEGHLGRPVLTANQALLWGMLRAVGSHVRPDGYGRLFDLT